MNNQQVTTTELAYLAGLIDGEGCFSLRVVSSGKSSKWKRILAGFEMCNTDPKLIFKCDEIVKKINVNMRIRKSHYASTKKEVWQIDTHRFVKVKRLIEYLLPYLIGKIERAELILKFINSRLERCKEGHNQWKHIPYTQEEIELATKVKMLNGRGTSETIREALATEQILDVAG